jgi:V-type H+-transporting ATPase subunit G
MENDGIQRLLKAEDEAAAVVAKARDARVQRLKAAALEAEKSSAELKKQLEREFQDELNTKDSGDSGFASKLKDNTAKEITAIDAGFTKNKQAVVELLIHHVTAVKLEVEEALKQAILTKHTAGEL